jgi:DtxR family Mn-dependent transcriptional regulator
LNGQSAAFEIDNCLVFAIPGVIPIYIGARWSNSSAFAESYLKALFNMSKNAGEVNVNELSKQLDIKMPTVTSMMKKLAEKQLVHCESYKPLRLTEKGKKEAALVVRKHRLPEMYLVDKMGFGWEEVHDIAEQVEHVRSAVFFDKIDELLVFPSWILMTLLVEKTK